MKAAFALSALLIYLLLVTFTFAGLFQVGVTGFHLIAVTCVFSEVVMLLAVEGLRKAID